MHKTVSIKAQDKGEFSAYVAFPETDMPAPAVVVAQEIFGVNKVMRDVCDYLAQAGFIGICPDLFWRQEKGVDLTDQSDAEWQKAFALYKGFDETLGVKDLIATLDFARNMAECTGKAGAMGYCLGGKLAYLMATRSDASCSVSYYGVGIENSLEEAKNIKNPLLMHIAEKDKFVSLDAQQKIMQALKNNAVVNINVYPDVDHAFARVGGAHYDKTAAQTANYRTADFLAVHLTAS